MKYIFSLLLVFPLFARCQDCSLKKETDKFSQQPHLTSGLVPFKAMKNPFDLSVEVTPTDIDILFSLNGYGDSKCFDDASTLTVQFDSTRTKLFLRNSGSMNCDGNFHLSFRNTATPNYNLQRLSNFKINTLRFTNDKIVSEVLLTPEQKQLFQRIIACIISQAPTLIKQ